MSIRYLDLSGAVNFWANIKNFVLSKIPTKTSELTNDSGFLTQHQSLSNYVTLNSEQTITGKKYFTNTTTKVNSVNTFTGSTLFIDTSASAPRGAFPESDCRVGRVYIGDSTSYNGAWFIVDPIISTNKAVYRMVTTNPDNTDSTRFSITWDSTETGARCRKNVSTGDLLPTANNTYNLGADDVKWDIGYIHNLIGTNKENASEDANNYYSTTSGSHMTFYTTTNGGTKLSNVPAAVNTQLESRTIRYLSASDWNVEQICHNTNGLYYRKGNNNGWGDWKTFAFTDSNITGTAANVTGTVAIANGGTGATTRLNAVKALTNESVGTPTHFLAITTNYAKAGYTTIAQAKTVLGITGDIVSHNASEFLTSHQSLSSCVKNSVVNSQTIKSTGITRGTAPSSAQTFGIAFTDNNNKYIGNIYGQYATDKSTYVGLYAYKGTTTSNSDNASVRVGYDASGNVYTSAPTPATTDNSTQIATTAFVYNTAAKHLAAATNIYVAKVATGNGSGSNTSNYMSLTDLRTYLATVHMHSAASNMNGSYNLQILFKAGDSFGDATFDATKMPGVRNLILNTSTGTNSTVNNYSTNSPTFGNINVTGDIAVTMRNLNCTGRISSQHGAYVSIDTYMGISSLMASNSGYLNVAKNMVINVCDAHADYFCLATNNGILSMWPGATVTINFRQQCYYSRSLFMSSSNGTAWIGYSSFKLTGTEPMAVWGGSGTLTGTSETAAATVEKAVTLASGQTFTLTTNATAKVKFTVDNTANNPTLNIGGTGAKPIYWNNAPVQATMLMKNITYDVKYNGSQFVIQNPVKRLTNNDFGVFRSNGNYNQTYNSGSWNFTGWTLSYGTGIENSNWRGSHIGNIQQNVSTSNNRYPVLISGTANATATTSTAPCFAKDVKINPGTNSVYATNFYENGTALSSKYALNENFGKGTTTYLYIKTTDFPTGSGSGASIQYNDVVDGTKLYVWYSVCSSSSVLATNPSAARVTGSTGQVWRYLGPTIYAVGLGNYGASPTGILGLFRRES